MTDTPPPLPPVGSRLDAGLAAQVAAAAAAPDPQPPAPTPAQTGADMAEEFLASVPDSLMTSGTGTLSRSFTSRRAADTVRLIVDGEVFECTGAAPANLLVRALDVRSSGDTGAAMVVMRRLVLGVLMPGSRERYEARLDGAVSAVVDGTQQMLEAGYPVTVIGETVGDEVVLPPIDIVDMIAHGMWLVGAYFSGRPTQPSGRSDSGQ